MSRPSAKKTVSLRLRRNRTIPLVALLLLAGAAFLYLNRPKTPERPVTTPTTSPSSFLFHRQGELTFISSDGRNITTIDIEIADTDDKRTLGLMYRQHLETHQGMLFVFPFEEPRSFWMRNTPLSLDMIFVDSRQRIVTIHPHTTPLTDRQYSSDLPALYVVEVKAGFTERFEIREGDRIQWKRL